MADTSRHQPPLRRAARSQPAAAAEAGEQVSSERGIQVRRIQLDEQLELSRGCPAVCIPVYGGLEVFRECLLSILRHTALDVPVLVADDATPDHDVERYIRELASSLAQAREILYYRQERNRGFVGNANIAFALLSPADVVLVNSDCVVSAGWLDSLRAAAYSDDTIATASALTNNGTILSVPYRNQGMPSLVGSWTVDDAAAVIREQSLRLRPRIPTAVGHCVYIRRLALDLVGVFDESLAPGYGEEVDFSQRCLLRGLCHVAADDVFVLHYGAVSFQRSASKARLQALHDRIITARYPYYDRAVEEAAVSTTSPLAQALSVARVALLGLSVTIDASCLGPEMTGTQVHTLELIRLFSASKAVRLRVAVPSNLGAEARRRLAGLPHLDTVIWEDVSPLTGRTDIVHRAYQISGEDELARLRNLGERIIITQQDLIAYRNPGYFPDSEAWRRYRALTREALLTADLVVFFSEHAADQARLEQIVDPERVRVVYIGTDHGTVGVLPPANPPFADRLEGQKFMLCLGTDFQHKNRLFSLRLLQRLQRHHDWSGWLVLAGPRVSQGSSVPEEQAFLRAHPEVAARTINLEGVNEATRAWLMQHAALLLYPTVEEGFGLVPFEASAAGVPCLFAWQTSLREILPQSAAQIVPWDVAATGERALAVMEDPKQGSEIVEAIRRAAQSLTWERTAEQLAQVYREVVRLPARLSEHLDGARAPSSGMATSLRLAVGKSLFLWRTYGALEGSRRVGRALARRIKRRLIRARPLDADVPTH